MLDPPQKYVTPYGGLLEWKLPGENKLVVHLKDKDKIRHKKRWSQVIYGHDRSQGKLSHVDAKHVKCHLSLSLNIVYILEDPKDICILNHLH